MASSPSLSPGASLDDPTRVRYLRTSTDESDGDDNAWPSRVASRSRVCTQESLRAICRKYSIPDDFTPVLAGDRSPRAPPPPGSVCVYVDALVAGMRLPLHPLYGMVLSHFGIAPGQLTPNGWRALAGFIVLSHFTGVPPSLAVFRHFFSLCTFQHKLYSFRGKEAVGLLFRQLTVKNEGWKKEFFFLSSSAPWPCPVHWGVHFRSAKLDPVLTSAEKVVAANLLRARGGSPIDLRKYLNESSMAAARIIGEPSPPPSPQGMGAPAHEITMEDIRAEKAAEAAAARVSAGTVAVKCEPVRDYDAPSFGKKRKLSEEHAFGESSSLGPSCPPGFSTLKTSSSTSQHRDGDTSDWKAARQLLQGIVPPWRERELAASKPADVVASSYTSVLQAANEVAFSLGYARELEKKLRASEREADALRAELRQAKAELAETKTNAEMARTAERAFSESSRVHARALAERELRGYERGMDDMKRAALRRYPHLDPARLVVPLHMPTH